MQDFRFLLYCSKMDDRFTASSGIPGPVGSGNLEQAIGNNLTGLTGDLGKTGKSFKSRTRLGPNKIDKSRTNLDRSVLWRFMHPCYHIKRSIVRSQFRFQCDSWDQRIARGSVQDFQFYLVLVRL